MRSFHLICGSAAALLVAVLSGQGCSSDDTSSSTATAATDATTSSTASTTSSTTASGGGGATSTTTTSTATASGGGGAGGGTGGCGAATPVALTVKNYLSWCSVTVDTGTASVAAAQTVCVAAGAVVPIKASPASSTFEIGSAPWHDTDGDTGTGEQGTTMGTGTSEVTATTETVGTTADCVRICCPFADGTGCDGIPEQCN